MAGLKLMPKVHGYEVLEVPAPYSIHFKAMDDRPGGENLGHAEFNVCQRVLYGKIRELYIVPMQQHDVRNSFLFRHRGASEITFGGQQPRVWRVGFCDSVKGPFAELYVPKDTSALKVESFGDSFSVWFS